MRSKKIASVVVALAFGLVTAVALAGSGPAEFVLKAKKGDVTFQHHKHQERTGCGECHHTKGPDGKQVIDEKGEHAAKCDTCHNKDFPNKKLNKPMKAFHKNCKGCHKEHKVSTKCNFCHKK